jgi:hypothetical protein
MNQLENLEKQFSDLAQKIYESGERRFHPCYPWILIRVVPKEQKVGHIIMSENAGSKEQNKPLHEGIVLNTWKPFVQSYRAFRHEGVEYHKYMKSDFKPGDRVLFPHHSGLPVNFLDDRHYRIVREITSDPIGGAIGIVHYDGDNKYKEVLDKLFSDVHSVTLSGK